MKSPRAILFSRAVLSLHLPGDGPEIQYGRKSPDHGKDAAPGSYFLNSEVRYRDSLDKSQISDRFRVPHRIVAKPASSRIAQMLPILLIIVLIGAGAGYYLLVMRKKK